MEDDPLVLAEYLLLPILETLEIIFKDNYCLISSYERIF